MATPFTFHLLPNAHLDPVWLWDWREGLNEGLITCRTILDLMDEYPDLTFIRGEAAIYEHIERTAPATFRRIERYVHAGRWDAVGGNFIQPDNNLPDTESLIRQFVRGQRYFRERFGKPARVAWSADCFGHSAGLPGILAEADLRYFAFMRPERFPMAKRAFWWESLAGARLLAYRVQYGWYGCERDEVPRRLDDHLKAAQESDLQNVGVFFGLGDHGGGPTRRMIEDIRKWAAAHPQVRVEFSTLHRFFGALEKEVQSKKANFIATHRGEINYCQRGCFSSAARVKFQFRQMQAIVSRAERVDAAISHVLKKLPADLNGAWDAVLFNSFHDILPGSSIERALEEQIAWMGGAIHQARHAEWSTLNALAAKVDTTVHKSRQPDHPSAVPLLLFNPHPYVYEGLVELEAPMDYRPIFTYRGRVNDLPICVWDARGRAVPFQSVATEHSFFADIPWRKRIVTPVRIPAMGWSVYEMGWMEGATPPTPPPQPATSPEAGVIENGVLCIEAKKGQAGVRVLRGGKPLLQGEGLTAAVFDDPWGSWGALDEDPNALNIVQLREPWTIVDVAVREHGPWRSALWVRLAGRQSWLELTLRLTAGTENIDIDARVLWNERSARLKLTLPLGAETAEFEVPGGSVQRSPEGQVPALRWVKVHGTAGSLGLATNALHDFDVTDGALRVTVARASRYAADAVMGPEQDPWSPAVDCGELKFRMLLAPAEQIERRAGELEQPVQSLLVPSHKGDLPRSASLVELAPANFRLLALKSAADGRGLVLRVQETAGRATVPRLTLAGRKVSLSRVSARGIATWRLATGRGTISARSCGLDEIP